MQLLPGKPENISPRIQVDISLEAVGTRKYDLIKLFCLYISRLKIYRRDMQGANITIITLAIAVIVSLTITLHIMPAHFPASLVQSTKTISVFQFARFNEREPAFRKCEGRTSDSNSVDVIKSPCTFNAAFVVFKNIFRTPGECDESEAYEYSRVNFFHMLFFSM